MAAQMAAALPHASAVVDEPAHIVAGWLAVTRGDLEVNREHPPLIKALAGAALAPLAPAIPPEPVGVARASSDFAFELGRSFLYGGSNDAAAILARARLPVIACAVLAGGILFAWGWALLGAWPAILALALFAFEPSLLGHGRLVTTDMGAALFSLAALACLERAQARGAGAHRPGARRPGAWDAAAGLSLGLALLTRYSSVLLVPIMAGCLLLDRRRAPRARWLGLAASLVAATLTIQAGYAAVAGPGEMSLFPLARETGRPLLTQPLASLESGGARWLPLPVPRLWIEGLDLARWKNAHVEGPSYLLGEISQSGWWSYFALALAMKGTLPFLALAIAGLVWAMRRARGDPAARAALIYFWVPASSLILMITALTRAQIGLRYILPALALLCLAGGVPAMAAGRRARAAAGALVTLALWHAGEALWIAPHHLSYFNEAAGGPSAGWRRLVDSNLDWGQDLPELARFLKEQGAARSNLYYFGTADPAWYGLSRAVPPEPGWFAVSATHLAGVYLPDHDYFAPLRAREPDAHAGYSILLYRLDQVPEPLTRPLRRP